MRTTGSHRGKRATWGLGLLAAVALLAVGAPAAQAEVPQVTGAHDNLRTGWYPDEPALAPAQLTPERFKKAFDDKLEGQVYAQPLVANGTLLVVTEKDWAYGLDPVSGAVRWKTELGQAGNVGTAVTAGALPEDTIQCTDLQPFVGVTGTPVIDTEHGIAYFVANSYEEGSSGPIAWYFHALTLEHGEEVPGFPVKISGAATNLPEAKFEAPQQLQRPALLLMNGVVYAAFGSHCDNFPYQGWIVGVSTSAAKVVTKWVAAKSGAAIWQSGGGLLSDASGQILFASGNGGGVPGAFDPLAGEPSPEGRLGESVARVEVQEGGALNIKDYFSPFNDKQLDEEDLDIGSWGPVGLPPPFPHLLVQEGKQGTLYLLNRDALGGREAEAAKKNNVVQEITGVAPNGVWGTGAVWPGEGGYVITPAAGAHMKIFKYEEPAGKPHLSAAIPSAEEMEFGSGSPIVTSSGLEEHTGTAWITWCPPPAKVPACAGSDELRAYNPATAKLLWHEPIGFASKFSRPGVGAGHVYVGTRDSESGNGHVIAFAGPSLTPSAETVEVAAPVGESASREVVIENTGSELEIKGVSGASAPFAVSGLPPTGTKLAPGEAIKATVVFKPSARGRVTGAFAVKTLAGETKIGLVGNGEESAKERGEREAKERAEREARERAEREAREKAFGPGPIITNLVLSSLKARLASTHARSHTRTLVVTYRLTREASVRLKLYRRVVSHHCGHGKRTCVRWVATKIHETVAGHAGSNRHVMKLGALPRGTYRLAATPFTRTITNAATTYAYIKVSH